MDIQQIQHLTQLARIDLSELEQESLLKDMNTILAFVDQLHQVTIPGGLAPVLGTPYNVMREDGDPHESGLYTDILLHNAPMTRDGYVQVKKIL